jgi:hypothetical protein
MLRAVVVGLGEYILETNSRIGRIPDLNEDVSLESLLQGAVSKPRVITYLSPHLLGGCACLLGVCWNFK